uniref:Uncharacterized protein n=1 Tax=Romanomermis culicivorax TaxID=13658 RepID=A0A915JCZ8_ROMCU
MLPPPTSAVAIFVEQGHTQLIDATELVCIAVKYEWCHGLPKSESDNACGCSRFDTSTNTCPTAEICDTSYITPKKNAKNDWRRQGGNIVSTDGRFIIRHQCDAGHLVNGF